MTVTPAMFSPQSEVAQADGSDGGGGATGRLKGLSISALACCGTTVPGACGGGGGDGSTDWWQHEPHGFDGLPAFPTHCV